MTEKSSQLKDYSAEAESTINSVNASLTSTNSKTQIQDSIYELLAVEKKSRLANDVPTTTKLAVAIIQLCKEHNEWQLLIENSIILFKRRAQHQKVMEAIVLEIVKYVNETPSAAVKKQLIEAIREITAGKIFVELERARVTTILAQMTESEGGEENINKAGDLLNEIQVETVGSMELPEKVEILLEQYRLNLLRKEYVRAEIIGKKIDLKQLNEPGMEHLRQKFYVLNISAHSYFNQYYEICRAYRELYYATKVKTLKEVTNASIREESSKSGKKEEEKDVTMKEETPSTDTKKSTLQPLQSSKTTPISSNLTDPQQLLTNVVLYGILSPWDAEISDILNIIKQEKLLYKLPTVKQVLESYLENSIQQWPLPAESKLQESLKNSVDLQQVDTDGKSGTERLTTMWKTIHQRITEHNIRVISNYYTHIQSTRLSELLTLQPLECEKIISTMVSNKQLFAKIDRTSGVITFIKKMDTNDLLGDLTNDIHSLLTIVDTTGHLIARELLLNKVKA